MALNLCRNGDVEELCMWKEVLEKERGRESGRAFIGIEARKKYSHCCCRSLERE